MTASFSGAASAVGNAGSGFSNAMASAGNVTNGVVGVAKAAANMAGNLANSVVNALPRIPAMILCTSGPLGLLGGLGTAGAVLFDFNPDEITISRSATINQRSNLQPGTTKPEGATKAMVKKVQPPKLKLSNIMFEGLTTKLRCDTLLNWMSPYSADAITAMAGIAKSIAGSPGGGSRDPVPAVMPELKFLWGPPFVGFMYDVYLTSLTVVYKRFNNAGMPIRALVGMELLQIPSNLSTLPTNPTSGGLPGRRRHMVVDGDSLQRLATEYYGKPGAWRHIARVNGISNPNRLRPGQQIYMPNPQELTDGGGG